VPNRQNASPLYPKRNLSFRPKGEIPTTYEKDFSVAGNRSIEMTTNDCSITPVLWRTNIPLALFVLIRPFVFIRD
jgi:hypothetical protein